MLNFGCPDLGCAFDLYKNESQFHNDALFHMKRVSDTRYIDVLFV